MMTGIGAFGSCKAHAVEMILVLTGKIHPRWGTIDGLPCEGQQRCLRKWERVLAAFPESNSSPRTKRSTD